MRRLGADRLGAEDEVGLAKYCATSVAMIDKSYGTYIRKDVLKPLIEAEDGPIPEGKVAHEGNLAKDLPVTKSRRGN
jgi:hypothetical protein